MGDFQTKDWTGTRRRALSATEIVASLARVEGWTLSGDGADLAIARSFHFDNFHETMAFVNGVALIAHLQDHHPELQVHYNRCVVRFNTHAVAGLTVTDFDCAARVAALLA